MACHEKVTRHFTCYPFFLQLDANICLNEFSKQLPKSVPSTINNEHDMNEFSSWSKAAAPISLLFTEFKDLHQFGFFRCSITVQELLLVARLI